jgi:hypothetical protein
VLGDVRSNSSVVVVRSGAFGDRGLRVRPLRLRPQGGPDPPPPPGEEMVGAFFVSSPASEASVGGDVSGRFGPMAEGVLAVTHPLRSREG